MSSRITLLDGSGFSVREIIQPFQQPFTTSSASCATKEPTYHYIISTSPRVNWDLEPFVLSRWPAQRYSALLCGKLHYTLCH